MGIFAALFVGLGLLGALKPLQNLNHKFRQDENDDNTDDALDDNLEVDTLIIRNPRYSRTVFRGGVPEGVSR